MFMVRYSRNRPVASSLLLLLTLIVWHVEGFATNRPGTRLQTAALTTNDGNDNDGESEAWDADVDYEKEWPSDAASSSMTPDPAAAWDALPNLPSDLKAGKLGIDLNLEPLTKDQVDQLQREAQEVINKAIDAGIEDIERLRRKMNREIESSKRAMQFQSELEAKQQQQNLMDKIDRLTNDFLSANQDQRKSTKLAASASKAMEGTGRGIEMGTWGVLDGKTVLADDGGGSLLGSVDNAKRQRQNPTGNDPEQTQQQQQENRILVIADTKSVRAKN
jgi:ribosomal protein S6